MKIYDSLPSRLAGRHQQNSVAINCDRCKNDFIWPKSAGDKVKCPCGCGNEQMLDVTNHAPLSQGSIT